jgi:hypothetical protein
VNVWLMGSLSREDGYGTSTEAIREIEASQMRTWKVKSTIQWCDNWEG